jgi:hypothetical protein
MSRPLDNERGLPRRAAPDGTLAAESLDPRVGRARAATARLPSGWRWAPLLLLGVYLGLLLGQLPGVVAATERDADAVSAPVIGELFGSAGAHAHVILGTFGWYATLLAELATKWLPAHRELWEYGPYALALAGAALVAWSAGQVAGRWAAVIAAALLMCAAPDTLHLLLSTTQHGPDWFCCALLGAFLVLVMRSRPSVKRVPLAAAALLTGVIIGVNAASDVLVAIAGIAPFVLALLLAGARQRGGLGFRAAALLAARTRAAQLAALMLLTAAISWALTDILMSAWNVAPEPGLHTTSLASPGAIPANASLWWKSIIRLGNGALSLDGAPLTAALAFACGTLSLLAIVLLGVLGWRHLRGADARPSAPITLAKRSLVVYWCASATVLSAAFLLSRMPVDIHADRYLVGVLYALAAVLPVCAAGHARGELATVLGTCVLALSGIVGLRQGVYTRGGDHAPPIGLAQRVAAVAEAHGLAYGYSAYWIAAPITWATGLHVHVYPVSVCDQGRHLCPFDLHVISSWYQPRSGTRSFLLIDPSQSQVPAPTPDLGAPRAIYHAGGALMYVYNYDIAQRIVNP